MFTLHPQLEKDTLELGTIGFCKLLLMNDSNYPWLILVPAIDGIKEIHSLTAQEQAELSITTNFITKTMQETFAAEKMNTAALGNMVPQLHIHIIARFSDDIAWPKPVWGLFDAKPYDKASLDAAANKIKLALNI